MRRSEIWLADLEPGVGSEANKIRPVVIASNDGANVRAARVARGMVTVVPVTSKVRTIYPFQVALPADATGLPHDSKAQAEQVRSIDARRLIRRLGEVPTALMAAIDEALRLHLHL